MLTCPILVCEVGTPRVCKFCSGTVWCSSLTVAMMDGSYEETEVPAPRVDETKPDAPAPAPPAPLVVPPAPAPGAPAPKPPTPPPGVPCTTPVFTPRKVPPALVRRMSMLAIGKLYRAIAKSRLFSKASRIASLSDKCSLPSRINWPSKGEFVICGSGTSFGEYALKGLCDFDISKETDVFVWARAIVVRQITSPVASRLLIVAPPHAAGAQGWVCRSTANHYLRLWRNSDFCAIDRGNGNSPGSSRSCRHIRHALFHFLFRHQLAVEQMDFALGVLAEARIVGHHADGRSFAVQVLQQLHYGVTVARVEISRGLIRQQD